MHWIPVVWTEVPPVLVGQALKMWAEVDVDGRWMWMERGLMEWKKLLKVLDMCLSL